MKLQKTWSLVKPIMPSQMSQAERQTCTKNVSYQTSRYIRHTYKRVVSYYFLHFLQEYLSDKTTDILANNIRTTGYKYRIRLSGWLLTWRWRSYISGINVGHCLTKQHNNVVKLVIIIVIFPSFWLHWVQWPTIRLVGWLWLTL